MSKNLKDFRELRKLTLSKNLPTKKEEALLDIIDKMDALQLEAKTSTEPFYSFTAVPKAMALAAQFRAIIHA